MNSPIFFTYQSVKSAAAIDEAEAIMGEVYNEAPQHWRNGLTKDHFDGGLYLVRKEASGTPVGFVGWQERQEGHRKVGYYSVGIRPQYRRDGLAKDALRQLLHLKSANVDEVRALIEDTNQPSKALASALGIKIKIASINI